MHTFYTEALIQKIARTLRVRTAYISVLEYGTLQCSDKQLTPNVIRF